MEQYPLQSTLDTCHNATSYRYLIIYVIICNYQSLCTAGLQGKGANYSLDSFEKINCHLWKIIFLYISMTTKPKHYFVVQKVTSHFLTVQQITALLKTQSHVLLNSVLLNSCSNIPMP